MRRVPLVAIYAVLALFVAALISAAGYAVWQQIPRLTEIPYPPNRAMRTSDPRMILIGTHWPHDGYCDGEFSATVKETPTEVIVVSFVDNHYSAGSCAGGGTVDQTAWAQVKLGQPLGTRMVIRGSDGVTLPIG